jgi:di/tricarboxylate transporter
MDIDKLKGSWKKYSSKLSSDDVKDEKDLGEILEKRSQRSLNLLRRNFFIEAGLNIIIVPVILLFLFSSEYLTGSLKFYLSAFIILILVLFILYLYNSYRKIYQYENNNQYLKDKLKQQIHILEKFIRDYFYFLYVAYFLGLIIGLSLDIPEDINDFLIRAGLGLGIGVAAFFLILRPFAKFYVRKLYSDHLHSLRSCLAELEENNIENNS